LHLRRIVTKDHKLLKARELAADNLYIMKRSLEACVQEGLIDDDDHYYNEILDLIADVERVKDWGELEEAIEVAKVLETDMDVWLSRQGRTTVSFEWPSKEDATSS
jgi:hypothetical protein